MNVSHMVLMLHNESVSDFHRFWISLISGIPRRNTPRVHAQWSIHGLAKDPCGYSLSIPDTTGCRSMSNSQTPPRARSECVYQNLAEQASRAVRRSVTLG